MAAPESLLLLRGVVIGYYLNELLWAWGGGDLMLEYIDAEFVGEFSTMVFVCCLDGYISWMDGGRSVSKFYFLVELLLRWRELLDFLLDNYYFCFPSL